MNTQHKCEPHQRVCAKADSFALLATLVTERSRGSSEHSAGGTDRQQGLFGLFCFYERGAHDLDQTGYNHPISASGMLGYRLSATVPV